jgi:glycosyltransferase involved in cell wall biosynthesis
MRILQVSSDPYSQTRNTGGIFVHMRNICERLAKNNEVTVYGTNRHLRFPEREIVNGVRVERFNCLAPGEAYYFSIQMLLKLRKAKFDVVHGHGYHAFPFHFAAEAERNALFLTPHFHGVGHTPFRKSLLRLLRIPGSRVFKQANRVIAVSEYEKNLLQQQFRLSDDRIEVIPNGVDFSEFSDLKKQSHEGRSLLYVGYLVDYKGADYLVEVLPRLEKDIILEIVGRGPLGPFLEKRARELGIIDRVKFYPSLARKELLQKFADADVFALLSTQEAYSIVVAEALAAKTPCVITRASALKEWEDGITCFGVDYPINLDKLAEKIMFAMQSSPNDQDYRKWYDHKILDWDSVTKKLENLYEGNQ